MYSSSRGSVHRPWVHQTMMMNYPGFEKFIIINTQMTSLVLCFHLLSRPHDQKYLQQLFKSLELLRASVRAQCRITRSL